MTEELFVRIILSAISIVGALVSAYVIPFLKSKITAQQLSNIQNFIEKSVRCAEQLYTPDEWRVKKEFVTLCVTEFISKHTNLKLTDSQIDTIIEGVVNEVKRGANG